jgi:hypothetical protein
MKAQKKNFMEHFKPTQLMFVTGLIKARRTSDTRISLKKKLHSKLQGMVRVKLTRKMRRKKKYGEISNFQNETKLRPHHQFCGL